MTTATERADPWSLSPAEAAARLESMKVAPPATGLAARLENDEWRQALLAGNGPHLREFNDLIEKKLGDNKLEVALAHGAEAAPIFETTMGDELNTWKFGKVVEHLRADDLSDDHIREMFANEPIAKELHDAARRLRDERFADPQYVDRWLKGGAAEKREQLLIGIILGRPIAEQTAA
jgi:hypothetical protein